MKAVLIFVALFILTIVQLSSGSLELHSHNLPSPFFAWGGKPYFNQRESETTFDSAKIKEFVLSAAQNKGSEFLNGAELASNTPEVILVFTHKKVSSMDITHFSHDNSFTNLKRLVEASAGSFSDAYANVKYFQTIPQYIADSYTKLSNGGNLIVSAEENVKWARENFVSLDQLSSTLKQKNILNNGVVDVVIVALSGEALAEDDARLSAINTEVKEATNGKYVAIFTSASAVESSKAYLRNVEEVTEMSVDAFLTQRYTLIQSRQSNNGSDYEQGGTYWPYYVSEGLIVGFTLLFFVFFFLRCMMSIQAPDRFEGGQRRNQPNKERAH